ncbi:hypothetical protein FPY71_01515 [Aureimonas fodinaquatilis]|uniref:Uncharacterized protein n=1 Tax=Aureimonas fodinaquatilis TaxID=2565783 RepID=A0A5B0DZH0_9HYPH|nr:hypothetical protein [Aureimonas fodinaquatilis]KAA0971836.1 hypothetical protein FPY71_01515 [Aureimonas fodinaquatilis]
MQTLLSAVLGFLSWNFYVTTLIVVAVSYLVGRLACSGNDKGRTSRVLVGGFALGVVAAIAMPHLNAAFLKAVGIQRSAIIHEITPYHVFNIGRATQLGENVRFDLMVEAEDGSHRPAYVLRKTGLLGPTQLVGGREASGDAVTVAFVEAMPSNLTIVTEKSDAVWQSRARSLDAAWEITPPDQNWVSHKMHRDRIEDFLANYGHVADGGTVARLEGRLEQLTEMPPAEFSTEAGPRQ